MSQELPDLEAYHFNGGSVLQDILQHSIFTTTAQAVAALTKFSHPETVAQTDNQNVFRTIRRTNTTDVGKYIDDSRCGRVMLDDNRSTTNAFVWANKSTLRAYSDVQFAHVWPGARDVSIYTSLANICVIPAFLAKLTDTDKSICALLKYRAYHLFAGFKPNDEAAPVKPSEYDDLKWASPLPPVGDLEACLRRAIRTKPKDRTVLSIQVLGWYFSHYQPEPVVKIF